MFELRKKYSVQQGTSSEPWTEKLQRSSPFNCKSWVTNDNYKSSKELVQLLVNIVAKGGNLLLGVGPDGKGEFEPKVYEKLDLLGKWLQANGEAILWNHSVEPYLEGKVGYTAKDQNTIFAIYMPAKDEAELPAEITIKTNLNGKLKVSLLESKQKLNSKTVDGGIVFTIPQKLRTELARKEAVVIRISKE